MEKSTPIILFALLLLFVFTPTYSFSIDPPIELLTGELRKLKFVNYEKLLQGTNPGNDPAAIDAGDTLEGILIAESITNVTGSKDLSAQLQTSELTGHFKISVVGGVVPIGLAGTGHLDFALLPGDFINLYKDSSPNWNPDELDAIARATDGDLWVSILPDSFFEAINDTIIFPTSFSLNLTWADLSTNNTGYQIIPQQYPEIVPAGASHVYLGSPHPSGHLVDLFFSSHLTLNTPIPPGMRGWDFRSEDPAYLWAEPPGPCIEIIKEVSTDGGVTWFDANTLDTAPGTNNGAQYRFTVSNCGTVDLSNVIVTDPYLGITEAAGTAIFVGDLLVGGPEVILTTEDSPLLARPDRCDDVPPPGTGNPDKFNEATVVGDTGLPAPNDKVDDTNPAWVKCVCIDIEKLVSVDGGQTFNDADSCDDSVMAQNGVEYQLVVTNCGSVVLEDVVVTDQTLFGSQGYFLSGDLLPGVNNQVTITKNDDLRLVEGNFCETFADQLNPENKLNNTAIVEGVARLLNADVAVTDADSACVECPTCNGSIGDYVWDDVNKDGIQDATEMPLAGVTVNLMIGNAVMATTVTDDAGMYQFTGLCPGTYTVSVVTPTGYLPTPVCSGNATIEGDANCSPQEVVSNNDSNTTIDFGFYKPLASIDIQKYVRICEATTPICDYGYDHSSHDSTENEHCDYNRDGKCDTGDKNYCDFNYFSCKRYDSEHCDYDKDGDCDSYDKKVCDKNKDGYCNYRDKESCFNHDDTGDDGMTVQCTDWIDADVAPGPSANASCATNASTCDYGHDHSSYDSKDNIYCDYNRDGKCDTGDKNYCNFNYFSCKRYDSEHCDYDKDGDCDSYDKKVCDKNKDGYCNYRDKQSCFNHDDSPSDNTASCGTASFKFVVTNTGNVPLTEITLTDSVYDVIGCEIQPSLVPGSFFSCEIGPFQAEKGQHTNIADATGQYMGTTVTASDSANYFGVTESKDGSTCEYGHDHSGYESGH